MRPVPAETALRLLDDARRDLDHLARLWPLVATQKLAGPSVMGTVTGWPHAAAGVSDESGDNGEDPVGEQVASERVAVEQWDQHAQLAVLDALMRLRRAAVRLAARVPAMAASVNAGRDPTDGRTQSEVDARRRGAVEAESACIACEHGVSDVGPLTAGLCAADRAAWVTAGHPDRQTWIEARRRWLAEEAGVNLGGAA
ncbi:MAG: hypothetical protein ACYCUG_06120 [Acidimicrobiales bacterium]